MKTVSVDQYIKEIQALPDEIEAACIQLELPNEYQRLTTLYMHHDPSLQSNDWPDRIHQP